ncbi:MAG: laccase domain-containing protein [Candidatus Nomurabacteria bacterium]|jgi:copper oxidase (laccase) domain-containing protein|nr:laccase domain-containing protein [Candidatus Nomurabacteria bacterium]
MKNEPMIFAGAVVIGLSNVADGDVRTAEKVGDELAKVRASRRTFLARMGANESNTVLVKFDDDSDDFCRYKTVDKRDAGRGMIAGLTIDSADALFTKDKNLALFLPLADCLGAVIYDTKNGVLAVAHLGRHSTEQHGARKVIEYMKKEFGSKPANIKVWFSPSADKGNYPLYAFDNQSLQDVNVGHLAEVGVPLENMTRNTVDTTTDDDYFSHSQGDKDKRFAIVAYVKK